MMAWTTAPTSGVVWKRFYDRYIQKWRALRERAWALGARLWPEGNIAWYEGIVTALTATMLTDSAQTWPHTWRGWTPPPESEHLPHDYTVVIDPDAIDPWDVIKADVAGDHGVTDDLPIGNISDYVTYGWIESLASKIGKPYILISGPSTRAGFGISWPDRWPAYPNDEEYWRGTVSSGTTSSLTEINASIGKGKGLPNAWATNRFVGRDVLVRGTDNLPHRVTVTANDKNTLSYPPQTWTPTGPFSLVAEGKRAWPGRRRSRSMLDYGGYRKTQAAHYPDATLNGVAVAAALITIQQYLGDPPTCQESSQPIFDVLNFWTRDPSPADCEPYDKLWTPDSYLAPRGLQVELEQIATSFVERKDYNGAAEIPTFTPSTWMKKADINWASSVVGSAGDVAYFNAGALPNGTVVQWSVMEASNAPALSGITAITDGRVWLGAGLGTHIGKTVIYSAEWTWRFSRRVRYFSDRTCFVPDVDTGEDGLGVIDPPRVVNFAESGSFGVGKYITRPKSTNYAEYDQFGVIGDTGPAFIPGEVARYIGDDFPHARVANFAIELSDLDAQYFHRFAVSNFTRPIHNTGSVTSSTRRSITDATKQWSNDGWSGSGGIVRTESGIASGGTTTSLTDAAKNITLEAGQMWIVERYPGSAPYVGFIIRVLIDSVWHKRPIINCTFDANVPTVTWEEPLPESANGKQYEIPELRYELNARAGRKLRLQSPAAIVTTTHSDEDTLWFAEQPIEAEVDSAYEIKEPQVGTTWRKRAAAGGDVVEGWDEVPVGPDPRVPTTVIG